MTDADKDRLITWIRALPSAATEHCFAEGVWISSDGRNPDPPPDPTPQPIEPAPYPPVPDPPPSPAG